MRGSINFFFHIIGVGLVFVTIVGGWIVEHRIQVEKDSRQKLFLIGLNRRFGLLTPFVAILLLLTGIVNIFNLYNGNIQIWYTQGWLIAKIILFSVLIINGAVFGPILIKRRKKFIEDHAANQPSLEMDSANKLLNRNITSFYLIQFIILLLIIYISILGVGKHPGII